MKKEALKQSDKKNVRYSAIALQLVRTLEFFVKAEIDGRARSKTTNIQTHGGRQKRDDKPGKIFAFCEGLQADAGRKVAKEKLGGIKKMIDGVGKKMAEIFTTRNDEIAHPNGHYLPHFDYGKLLSFRAKCREVDEDLGRLHEDHCIGSGMSPMSRAMFHELRYEMGNAGDLIKHGALAHFAKWWFDRNEGGKLLFADPFGGCPWEEMGNEEIKKRFLNIGDRFVAECIRDSKRGLYYNSGHIVDRVARRCGGIAGIRTSDRDEIARSDLLASGIKAKDMSLLDDEYADYEPGNGYSVLKHAGDFHLILLDPYSAFLRDEFSDKKKQPEIFERVLNAVEDAKNHNLCVMIFVLDMWSKDTTRKGVVATHDNYFAYRNGRLHDCAISLRCPKIADSGVAGESGYQSEILLISQMFANGGGADLRESLRKFAIAATEVLRLEGEKVEVWPE